MGVGDKSKLSRGQSLAMLMGGAVIPTVVHCRFLGPDAWKDVIEIGCAFIVYLILASFTGYIGVEVYDSFLGDENAPKRKKVRFWCVYALALLGGCIFLIHWIGLR